MLENIKILPQPKTALPNPPREVQLEAVMTSSLRVDFKNPARGAWENVRCKVTPNFSSKPQSAAKIIDVTRDVTSCTFNNLLPGGSYNVSVWTMLDDVASDREEFQFDFGE